MQNIQVEASISQEEAERILQQMILVDEGNETIVTDIFTRFLKLYPEHRGIVNKLYQAEFYKSFEVYRGD